MNHRRATALLLVAGLAAPPLAGCDPAPPTPPTTVVELPDMRSTADLSDTTHAVRLSAGQVVAVQVHRRPLPGQWRQVTAGDPHVLQPDGTDTIKACPTDQVGCGPTVAERYRAVSAGTTTIEWDFVGMGPGVLPAGVSTAPCPTFGRHAQCPIAHLKIAVKVA